VSNSADGFIPLDTLPPADDGFIPLEDSPEADAFMPAAAPAAGAAPVSSSAWGFTEAQVADEAAGQQDDEVDMRLRLAFTEARRQGPRAQQILKVSEALGVKTSTVESNFDTFRVTADEVADDPKRFRKENELLASVITKRPHLGPALIVDKEAGAILKAVRGARRWFEDTWQEAVTPPAPQPGEMVAPVSGARALQALATEALTLTSGDPELAARTAAPLTPEELALRNEARAAEDAPKKTVQIDTPEARALRNTSGPIAGALVLYRRAQEKRRQLELADKQTRLAWAEFRGDGETADQLKRDIYDEKLLNTPAALGDTGFLGDLVTGMEGAVSTELSLEGMAKGGSVGAAVAGGAAFIAGTAATKSPAAGARLALQVGKMGGSVGAKVGAAEATFTMEFGPAYEELRALKTDTGEPLTVQEAFGAALFTGGLSASLELVGLEKQLAPLGTAKAALAARLRQAAATDPTARKLLVKLAKEWAVGSLAEGTTEGMQQAVQQLGEYLGSYHHTGKAPAAGPYQLEPIVESAVAGFKGGFLMGGGGAAVSLATHKTLSLASQQAKQLPAILAAARNETVRSAPEQYVEVLKEVTGEAGKPVDALFVDGKAGLKFYQENEADPAAAMERDLGPEGAKRMEEAAATGGRVKVPMEQVLGTWGASKAAEALLADTTTQPALLTPRELEAQGPEILAAAQKLAEDSLAQEEQAQVFEDGLQVQADELVATGRLSVQERRAWMALNRRAYQTLSANQDISAEQMLERLRISFARGEEGQTRLGLDATREQKQRIMAGKPSALEFLAAREASHNRATPEGKQAAVQDFFRDSTSGALNARAWARMEKTAKSVASISVEGIKYENDLRGHEAGNAVYAAAARALAPYLPTLAKVHGDFAVANLEQQQLDDILAKANLDPGLNGFRLVGAVGPTLREASATANASKQALEHARKQANLPGYLVTPEAVQLLEGQLKDGMVDVSAMPKADRSTLEAAGLVSDKGQMSAAQLDALRAELARRTEGRPAPKGRASRGERPADAVNDAPLAAKPADVAMVPEELQAQLPEKPFAEQYLEADTGLFTKDARDRYLAAHPMKFWADVDLNLLKAFNEEFGDAVGDKVLATFGKLATAHGAQRFIGTHVSGDEYSFHADDERELRRFLKYLLEQAIDAEVSATTKTGKAIQWQGLSFGVGIGENADTAAAALITDKAALAEGGFRGATTQESRELVRQLVAHDSGGLGRVAENRRQGGLNRDQVSGREAVRRADPAGAGAVGREGPAALRTGQAEDAGGNGPLDGEVLQRAVTDSAELDAAPNDRAQEADAKSMGFNAPEAIERAEKSISRMRVGTSLAEKEAKTRKAKKAARLESEDRFKERVRAYTAFIAWVKGTGPRLVPSGLVAVDPGAVQVSAEVLRETIIWARSLNIIDPQDGLTQMGKISGLYTPDQQMVKQARGLASPERTEAGKARQRDAKMNAAKHLHGQDITGRRFSQENEAPAPEGPRWYSAAERAVSAAKQAKNTGAAWWAMLQKAPGVKAEELEWLGIKEWLLSGKDSQGREVKSLTKDDVAEFIRHNKVEVTEKVLVPRQVAEQEALEARKRIPIAMGHAVDAAVEADPTAQKELGNAEDFILSRDDYSSAYDALLIVSEEHPATAPHLKGAIELLRQVLPRNKSDGVVQYESYRTPGAVPGTYKEILLYTPAAASYRAPHFGELYGKGLLAHARVATHKTADGAELLLVEEIQSDLHQAGREKGYAKQGTEEEIKKAKAEAQAAMRTSMELASEHETLSRQWGSQHPQTKAAWDKWSAARAAATAATDAVDSLMGRGIVDAPFKQAYEELAAKRILQLAAEKGLEKVGWTTGQTQAARYDLRKSVREIRYNPETQRVVVLHSESSRPAHTETANEERLVDLLGKDLATRLLEQPRAEVPVDASADTGPHLKTVLWDAGVRDMGTIHQVISDYGSGFMDGKTLAAIDGMDPARREAVDAAGRAHRAAVLDDEKAPTVPGEHILTGDDLAIGGEGMKTAYDQRIPGIFRKLVKRFGGEVKREPLAGNGPEVWTVTVPQALKESIRSEGMALFQDDDKVGQPKRGYMEVPAPLPGALERVYRIFLNKRADASTIMHESAHAWLEMLHELGKSPDATEKTLAHLAQTRAWLGAPADLSVELTIEQHEKFAKGFEVYLMEGTAPTADLVHVFTQFRLWLTQIYRSLRGIDVELNDNARAVFDRFLATDEQMQEYRRASGPPLFTTAEEAGMTPEQWAQHQADLEEADSLNVDRVLRHVLLEQERALQGWWLDEERAVQEEAAKEWDNHPMRKAWRDIDEGIDIGDGRGEPIKFDRAAVVAMAGPGRAKRLPTLATGGTHPDEVAEHYGFTTGGEFLVNLLMFPTKETFVQRETAARMAERHPAELKEKEALRAALARADAKNKEARLLEELVALEGTGRPGEKRPALEAFILAAKNIAARTQLKDINPSRALAEERRQASTKARAGAKGNVQEAVEAAQKQILNSKLYQELLDARDEREALLELAREMSTEKARARWGKANPIYRDAIDFLVEAVQLTGEARLSPAEWQAGWGALQQATGLLEQDGVTVGDWLGAMGELLLKNDWRNLTVAEGRLLKQALENLRAGARQRNTVLIDGKRVEKDTVIEAMLGEVKLPKRAPGGTASANTIQENLAAHYNSAIGFLLAPSDMVRELVDDDRSSTWWKVIVTPFLEAKRKEADLLDTTVQPIIKAFEALPKEARKRMHDKVNGAALFPGHVEHWQPPRRRFELLMMALNMGNAGNMQRLTDGRGITEAQVVAALDTLTAEEVRWVQSIFDAAEGLRPAAFDLEERDSGLRPEAVVARPLKLKNGTLRGGYFPAVYERGASTIGERQVGQAVASLLDPTFTRSSTPHSHLKKRADKVEAVISLEPSVIYRHFAQVAHDIAFREAVKSTGGLILDERIDQALKRHLGDGKARQFLQWVKDVAGNRGMQSPHWFDRLVRGIRANAAPAILGWSIPTAVGDLANLLAAVPSTELKAKYLAVGLSEYRMRPSVRAAALKASPELRFMKDTIRRDFAKQVSSLTARGPLNTGPVRWWKDHAFLLMEAIGAGTATPIWLGAYHQGIAEGKTHEEAVAFGDDILTRVFPSHSPVDQAAILRDKGFWGLATMFYGYLSTMFRSQYHLIRLKKYASLLGLWVSAGVLGELWMGRGAEDSDEDDEGKNKWARWFLRKMVAAPLSTLPFGLAGDFESRLLKKPTNPRGSPFNALLDTVMDGAQKALDGDADSGERALAAMRAIGPVTGIPTRPFASVGSYLLNAGDDDGPLETASGLIYGLKKDQPETLLTLPGGD
jgi:GGDEF domain-containing protein